MSPTIILCGASVRAAAFSALRAGFTPYAIDLFADRDLAAIRPAVKIARYPDDFEPALADAPEAPWIYTGGLENHPSLAERLARIRPLWGNGGQVLRAIRDPRQLASVLGRHGLAYPALDPTDDGQERWLRKPLGGSAGLGVRMATAADLQRPGKRHYLQQYIAGQAASAVYLAWEGKATLLGALRQLIGQDWGVSPPFVYVGSVGPLPLTPVELRKLNRLGNVLAGEFGLVGLFNADLVQTPDELWTIEVNPRYSASVEILERAAGTNFLSLHAAACQSNQQPSDSLAQSSQYFGKAVVYADRDCRCHGNLDNTVLRSNDAQRWPLLADIPQSGQAIAKGQPVTTVFAEGNSLEQAEQRLRALSVEVLGRLQPSAG